MPEYKIKVTYNKKAKIWGKRAYNCKNFSRVNISINL